MHSPRVLLCLGREFPIFKTLLLVRQPGNGTLQVVIFVGDLRMHIVYFLIERALYCLNFLISLNIQHLLFLHKGTYYLA